MKSTMSGLFGGLFLAGLVAAAPAFAQDAPAQPPAEQPGDQLGADLRVNEAASLDELLRNVQERQVVESRALQERLARFQRERNQQQQLLQQARQERTREEQRSERLETTFEENEIRIGNLQEQLDNRLGSLRELFGVLQQVAGDTRGLFSGSVVSAQYPGRGDWLGEFAARMGTASSLATIEEMERLWFELQREMTESGKVVKFPGTVVLNNGERLDTDVVRVGSFNLIAGDRYIKYEGGTLNELGRQPAGRYTSTAEDLAEAAPDEIVGFAIDPTRGSLLDLLIQGATLGERVGTPFGGIRAGECYLPFCDGEGSYVGSVIILLGIFGIILGVWKLIQLSVMYRKVQAQKQSSTPDLDNPLGRVLNTYHENRDTDVETLELKLGEAILAETPKVTSNINLIQVISVVAPLLGLLGTVTGMIVTFQAITLFGAGDPQTMASGIAQALMTTVEGLVVAIPMTLLHAIVAQRSRGVIHVLEEQSAGLIAEHAERSGQALG
ncbi:MAG TPA: MotA/TolQ/ExbB proton channel family protein [Pseudomonadales bacterium]